MSVCVRGDIGEPSASLARTDGRARRGREAWALRSSLVIAALLLGGCDAETRSPDANLALDAPSTLDASAPAPAPDLYAAAARQSLTHLDPLYWNEQMSVLAADAMLGRQNQTGGGAAAREHIIGQMMALGVNPAAADGGYQQAFAHGTNIVGIIDGADPALNHEYVLVSAHYDHLGTSLDGRGQCAAIGDDVICNGASDNASGVATVLAMIDALNTNEAGLRRSLLVVFWDAEEDGLLGSTHFVEAAPLVPLADLAAMFSVDIVGTRIIPGVDVGFGLGMDYSEGIREVLHAVNDELGTAILPVSLNFSGGDGGRSDHKPFQEAGVPVVFFGSGSSPVYHTAADDPDVIDPGLAMMMTRHVFLVTAKLANALERPSYVDGPRPHLDDAYALRELGRAILADPTSVGLDNAVLVDLVSEWVDQLELWIETPPSTDAEWEDYAALIDGILDAVYAFI